MASKPATKSWNDVQLVIAVTSMAATLAFWNLFAGPDRETALKRAQEQAAFDQVERERLAQEQAQAAQAQAAAPTEQSAQTIIQPTPQPMTGPILLGGSAPQTVIIQGGRNGGGNRGGNNTGGGNNGGGTGGS